MISAFATQPARRSNFFSLVLLFCIVVGIGALEDGNPKAAPKALPKFPSIGLFCWVGCDVLEDGRGKAAPQALPIFVRRG